MKNTKFTKLAVLLMAVALLIGSAIGITVSAEETETEAPAELSVYEANVVYNDMMLTNGSRMYPAEIGLDSPDP